MAYRLLGDNVLVRGRGSRAGWLLHGDRVWIPALLLGVLSLSGSRLEEVEVEHGEGIACDDQDSAAIGKRLEDWTDERIYIKEPISRAIRSEKVKSPMWRIGSYKSTSDRTIYQQCTLEHFFYRSCRLTRAFQSIAAIHGRAADLVQG